MTISNISELTNYYHEEDVAKGARFLRQYHKDDPKLFQAFCVSPYMNSWPRPRSRVFKRLHQIETLFACKCQGGISS